MKIKATINRLIGAIVSQRLVASVVTGLFVLIQRLTDSASTTDQHNISASKATSDNTFTSDDEQVMSFVKVRTEGVSAISDNAVLSPGKSSSDSALSSDSGSLLIQDYVNDPLYFADDYVGTKATF